ncbi:AAA family ATPase [Deinococcus sp. ME38]|uniref:AAA family ATPase n=1 Tax=Deinococcus sp. ME38 TaxID=3400344 RepID=UPI003B5C2E0A
MKMGLMPDRTPGRIHALHGFIGSGKTTLARTLEQELGALRFTSDEWMTALYGQDPPADEFPVLFRRVMTVMEAQWTRAVTLGVPVILDHGFWTRAARDELRAQASALGALLIADATFDLFRPRFEPLTPAEEALQDVTRLP